MILNREESKSKTKAAARDKPHGERNQKSETERRNKSCGRKKKKKKKGILTLMSITWVLKLELSHLMREASYTSFIGRAWSRVQLMRQKIWTPF